MIKAILVLLFFLLASCNSNDTSDLSIVQNIYDDNNLEDYELFEQANKYIKSDQLDLALIELDKIDVLFPSSPYANRGMLVNAYIHFLKKDYEKTRAIAENYKNYYPGSKDIAYANYLEAMTYYILIKKPNYSQENANKAYNKFNFILNAYPNSKYEIDIITKIQIIDNNIAANKLNTAKFYLNKGNFNGSLIYLKDIFDNHSSSLSIEEALYHIVKIYHLINEKDLAKEYAAILGYNFPESKWYKMSFNLINNIENINDKENWFKNFNPIKLFIKEEKKENFEIKEID